MPGMVGTQPMMPLSSAAPVSAPAPVASVAPMVPTAMVPTAATQPLATAAIPPQPVQVSRKKQTVNALDVTRKQ